MSRNLNLRLFDAGKIAIPLKAQPDCPLNPEPNFLIIESIFDAIMAPFPTPTGEFVNVECMNTYMKLVYREILPEANGKPADIREVLMDNVGNIAIPDDYVRVFRNHERMVENEELINTFLPMFNFRGVLAGYKLEFDANRSQAYLNLKAMPPEDPEVQGPGVDPENEPTPMP
jgi:hypothetical protein